jgi:hypothetical protein
MVLLNEIARWVIATTNPVVMDRLINITVGAGMNSHVAVDAADSEC